ncbi:MAG: S1 RNA-binding domain-containing protein, partial [Myxococcales bacterium]|nr:S1 RNA-binding domain-containing protein [Myxococcales bacterium]
VHQPLLAAALDGVVEDCVNHVGVELATASAPLLARVAGVGPTLAQRIVEHRDGAGLRARKDLLKVKGLGAKTYEQCAGFLRLRAGAHPLDASAVHPERYALVEQMAKDLRVPLARLVGNADLARQIDVRRYVSAEVGEPTLRDIVAELAKPGRDPREAFEPPKFRDDVQTLEDLTVGMILEGVVTNVVAFGAFVDLGVHQDGLVHVSQLSDRFVRDPAEVVAPGQKVKVMVMEVDRARRRIALSMKTVGR